MTKILFRDSPRSLRGEMIAALMALVLGGPLSAQDAPEASFSLIGDVSQKVTFNASDWAGTPTPTWAFATDLKPKFRYGAVSFQADTTWNIPLPGKLSLGDPSTIVVSEAYFRVTPVESLDLTFGQKRFSIGVGQTFTVGDSLNPVIGFFDQKTGFRGATAEWSPVSWASVSAAASAEGTGGGAGQIAFLLDKLQVTASVAGKKDKSFNPGVGASYDLAGVIVTAEGAAEFLPQGQRPVGAPGTWKNPDAWSAPALSASAGARYTVTLFDVDFTVSGEYLHWAQGFTADETSAWKVVPPVPGSPAAAAKEATHGIRGQENAFFRFMAASGTEYAFSSFAAVDLQDRSVLGQGVVTWAPWDNFEVDLTLQAAGGDAGSSWEFLNPNKDRYQASFSTTYHF